MDHDSPVPVTPPLVHYQNAVNTDPIYFERCSECGASPFFDPDTGVIDFTSYAKRNNIENAEFFCGDAGQAALQLEKDGVRPDVVVVDPPRKGLNADTIEALHRMAPRRIVYVSCDPATLARDVALLKERGYVLKNALAADLFPRCSHVESIVTMIREG
jgi:23S rRNA (uracil1939-C5)-methyltransferase